MSCARFWATAGSTRGLVEALEHDGRMAELIAHYRALLARATRNPILLIRLGERIETGAHDADLAPPLQRAQCLLQLAVYLKRGAPGDTILTRARSRLTEWAPAGAHDEIARAIAKVPPEAYIDVMKAIFEIDFVSELATVRAPSLVLWGEHDEVTPIEHSRQIADGIAGAVLKTIPDAGHIANIDQPEAFNRHLADFLDAQPE